MLDGELLQQATLVPPTAEIASGSWPTPAANEYECAPDKTTARRERIAAQKINGNGFGLTVGQAVHLWATPCTPNGGRVNRPEDIANKGTREDGTKRQVSLESQAKAWQTPTTTDAKGWGYTYASGDHDRPYASLVGEARAWGTPTTRDHKDTGDCSNVPDNGLLGRMAKSWSGMTDQPGSLNPEFHLWLMGWPEGWTALEPLAMDKYQSWLRSHGGCSDRTDEAA